VDYGTASPVPDPPAAFADRLDLPDPDETVAAAASAGIDTSRVQVVYTDTLPDGVFVVYRGNPARLLVNEAWWRSARPVERIQALESLWARLQTIPTQSWGGTTPP
jgi:hypothetical protein